MVGEVHGTDLRNAALPVAGAASREHALPIFTGVRLRSDGERLTMLATDRYRMASVSVPWQPAPDGTPVDALVPAAVLAEMAKHASRADQVAVHTINQLFGLAWADGSVVAATLDNPFPDTQVDRLLHLTEECAVEVDADTFAGALKRVAAYGGTHGRIGVGVGDGVVVIRASDPLAREAEETVKASVRGDHLTRAYQARACWPTRYARSPAIPCWYGYWTASGQRRSL